MTSIPAPKSSVPTSADTAAAGISRADLDAALEAHDRLLTFAETALERFVALTNTRTLLDKRGRPVEALTGVRDCGGYGHWRLDAAWVRHYRASVEASAKDASLEPTLRVIHYLDGDRGPGMVTAVVEVPVALLVGEVEAAERRALFEELSAEFGDTTSS